MRPTCSQDAAGFADYTCGLLAALLQHAAGRCASAAAWPLCRWVLLTRGGHGCSAQGDDQGSLAGQQRFCRLQRLNAKTQRMLAAAFGLDYAERYMSRVLFDPP